MDLSTQIIERLKASGLHLLVSLVVASAVAALVFGVWFPGAYRDLAGGTRLLSLIVTVDVVMGPLLTLAVYDRRKSANHLRKDIATIAGLQLAALFYGLYSVQLARPVALVFENDRFRVIAAAEVVEKELPDALPAFRSLPWNGPRLIAIRKTEAGKERNDALTAAIFDGVDTSQRPGFWIPYDAAVRDTSLKIARPVTVLLDRYAGDRDQLLAELGLMGVSVNEARFLPVRARVDAVAILDQQGELAGFLLKDGFF